LANSFWKREKRMKKVNSTLLYSRFGKPENFRKLFAKKEERRNKKFKKMFKEIQRICGKVVCKGCQRL